MNRNSMTRFSRVPARVDLPRSSWSDDHSILTSFNTGDLVPIEYQEIIAGDTVSLSVSSLIRGSTPFHPVMDDAYLDTYFFYVPFRLVWDHWRNFMGENTESAWAPQVEYTPPKVKTDTINGTVQPGSLADYFKMPLYKEDIEFDAMRFRAYRLIWNEWFRSEAIQIPLLVNTGDTESDISLYLDPPLKANKFHDYFTSGLPSPQRGAPASIPLLGIAPLTSGEPYEGPNLQLWNPSGTQNSNYILQMRYGAPASERGLPSGTTGQVVGSSGNNDAYGNFRIYNLYTDLTDASAITINDFRRANAIQLMLEQDARSGGRYREILRAHFGVSVPDTTVQVPEYLGGRRVNLRTQEVMQTSASQPGEDITPQGNVAAMSKTVDKGYIFTKSFTEPGMIIGLAVVRTLHTYQYGIPRDASRKTRYDFYWPALAALGEQGIKNKEIFATGNAEYDEQNFAYQEAFAEYRYTPNAVTGEMRSNSPRSLDVWHYADDYAEPPILSDGWIKETKVNVDRTLAVSSELSDQWKAGFYFDLKWTRPMPLYSVPGLSARF